MREKLREGERERERKEKQRDRGPPGNFGKSFSPEQQQSRGNALYSHFCSVSAGNGRLRS